MGFEFIKTGLAFATRDHPVIGIVWAMLKKDRFPAWTRVLGLLWLLAINLMCQGLYASQKSEDAHNGVNTSKIRYKLVLEVATSIISWLGFVPYRVLAKARFEGSCAKFTRVLVLLFVGFCGLINIVTFNAGDPAFGPFAVALSPQRLALGVAGSLALAFVESFSAWAAFRCVSQRWQATYWNGVDSVDKVHAYFASGYDASSSDTGSEAGKTSVATS